MHCLEEGMVFYQIFLISPVRCTVTHCRNCKRLREFEEMKSQGEAVEGDFILQGRKLLKLLSLFRPRIRRL
jgi:hypothetical protein